MAVPEPAAPAAPDELETLRVCLVSPTHLGLEGYLGGGERYVEELAKALALRCRVKLVSFGPESTREGMSGGSERVILTSWTRSPLTPFSPRLFQELREAEVVHCFQYFVLPTFLAAAFGRLRGRRVFVSDLGGGGWTPGYHLDQSRWITAHLPISRYAARELPGRNTRHEVIYGGVDPERYSMRAEPSHDGSIVFLGRILAHKGIHHLIEAVGPETPLHVVGTVLDEDYLDRLRKAAAGKRVTFHHGLPDTEVIALLHRAMALVHPTPVDAAGSAGVNELLGLAPIEAMACGCPVIASAVGPLPEVVVDEETGLLVPPNDPASIARALSRLAGDAEFWRRLSLGGRQRAECQLSWDAAATRCIQAYGSLSLGRTKESRVSR